MKKTGSVSDFTEERNAELRKHYFSQSGYEAARYTTDHMLQLAVKSPASRFWVDPDRARDVISRYQRDPRSLDRMLPGRRAMYIELCARYQDIRKSRPDASMIECVTEAVYSEAPEFFLSPLTARRIIFERASNKPIRRQQ